ncbi:MAG TPA: ribosome maturation factor RimM [Candidatus Limnocylindria bacterium]|jgi:16S rRNA processing protein RimM|nr:ribosome maturation factor RimM [Candidatus Limnocylindria bacterium]
MGPRSTSRSISDDDLVVGFILGPHGVRGEVRIDPRTDVADRFRAGAVLQCDDVGPLTVTAIRGEAAKPIVHFEGYATRAAAESLRRRFLRVPRTESRRATAGAFLWADLLGARVETPDGAPLGIVRDLLRAGENDVLVVADEAGRERLLPMLESVVKVVDADAGRIVAIPQEEAG